MKTQLFPRQAIARILFVLDSRLIGDSPCGVWFDLDNSLTRWKIPLLNSLFAKFLIFRLNPHCFPRQAIAKTVFVIESKYTGNTPTQVLFDLDNSLTWLKRPISNIKSSQLIRNNRKFPYDIPNFILRKLWQNFFCYRLKVHRGYSNPSSVWSGQFLTRWKNTYF